jgi:hypothetical protein
VTGLAAGVALLCAQMSLAWAPVLPAPPQQAQPPAPAPQAQGPAPLPGPTPPPSALPAPPAPPPPADAATALERARAAYEYGDMEMVVESARLVAEGRLRPTPAQREQALRYLGIGLYVTNRLEGAETAFFDLLRLRPSARLDPTITRPDCVAFFEQVRQRHAAEIKEATRNRPGKSFALALLPPFAQFQNGSRAKGLTFGVIEALSGGTALYTFAQLHAWQTSDDTFGSHHGDAYTYRAINWISFGVFVATFLAGVVDGVANLNAEANESTTARWDGASFRF